jgi:hypothetical protein
MEPPATAPYEVQLSVPAAGLGDQHCASLIVENMRLADELRMTQRGLGEAQAAIVALKEARMGPMGVGVVDSGGTV